MQSTSATTMQKALAPLKSRLFAAVFSHERQCHQLLLLVVLLCNVIRCHSLFSDAFLNLITRWL